MKLYSDHRKGEEFYFETFENIYKADTITKIHPEKAMAFRTQDIRPLTFGAKRHKVLSGKLVKFTVLSEDKWYNSKSKDFQNVPTPENSYPNGQETEYIFIPAAHRFYFKVNPKVSIKATEIFLAKSLKAAIRSDEDFKLILIQSSDSFAEIINASVVKSLKVTISYTNDDIGKAGFQLIDKFLKDANIGESTSYFKPDQKGSLNTDNEMLRGYLEVAKENGEAEASIITKEGKRDKVITKDFPEKRAILLKPTDDPTSILFQDVMKEYRDNKDE